MEQTPISSLACTAILPPILNSPFFWSVKCPLYYASRLVAGGLVLFGPVPLPLNQSLFFFPASTEWSLRLVLSRPLCNLDPSRSPPWPSLFYFSAGPGTPRIPPRPDFPGLRPFSFCLWRDSYPRFPTGGTGPVTIGGSVRHPDRVKCVAPNRLRPPLLYFSAVLRLVALKEARGFSDPRPRILPIPLVLLI